MKNKIVSEPADERSPAAGNRQVRVQEIELQCIRDFADRMKNLPQLNPEAQA